MPSGPPASSASVSPQNLLLKRSQGSAGASPVPQSTGRPWRGGKERWGCPEQGRSLGEPSTGREGCQASQPQHTDLAAHPWGWSWPAGHGTTGDHPPLCSASCCSWSSSGGEAASCRSQSRGPGTSWRSSLCCHALSWARGRHPHHQWYDRDNAPSILTHPPCFLRAEVQLLWLSLRLQFPHLKNRDSLQGGCAYWWMWIATLPIRKCCLPWKTEDHQGLQKEFLELSLSPWLPKHTLRSATQSCHPEEPPWPHRLVFPHMSFMCKQIGNLDFLVATLKTKGRWN